MRTASELTTPVSDIGWDWEKVNRRMTMRNPITFFILLFVSWKTVTAPENTPCELKNLHGDPLYRFKAYKGCAYCLEMDPSPGFPGS